MAKVRVDTSAATCSKVTNGDHSTTAKPISSMPRRPARPVSCVYSPGVRNWWRSPVNLLSFSMTTARAGMLMPRARVSVANTSFTSPALKHGLDRLLERRHHAGVVGGDAGLHARRPPVPAEDVEVVVAEGRGVLLADGPDALALLGAW